jgi:serine/threonine protein kinase
MAIRICRDSTALRDRSFGISISRSVWTSVDLDRAVAIKVLPADKLADPSRKQRFVQDARAASALNHPNIVTIYDIRSQDGTDFIVMEYIKGQTLEGLIARKGIRRADVLKYAVQIADAFARAHGAGILHRDLKPSNLMISDEGRVKVLDFGVGSGANRFYRYSFAIRAL